MSRGRLEVITAHELYYMGRPVEKIEVLNGRTRLRIYTQETRYEYPVGILHTGLKKNYVIFQDIREHPAKLLGTIEIPGNAVLIVRFKNGIALEVREK